MGVIILELIIDSTIWSTPMCIIIEYEVAAKWTVRLEDDVLWAAEFKRLALAGREVQVVFALQ